MTDLIAFETKTRCNICKTTMPDNEDLTLLLHVAKNHNAQYNVSADRNPKSKLVKQVNAILKKESLDK